MGGSLDVYEELVAQPEECSIAAVGTRGGDLRRHAFPHHGGLLGPCHYK